MAFNKQNEITVGNHITQTSVDVIHITSDKLVNILTTHFNKLNKPHDIIGALALSLSLVIALITSTFNERWGISPDTWYGIFITLLVISIIYLLYTIYNRIFNSSNIHKVMKDITGRNIE